MTVTMESNYRCVSRWMLAACLAVLAAIWTTSAASAQARPGAKPRVLAPGVMTTVSPDLKPKETVSRQDVLELTSKDSADVDLEFATNVDFRGNVWGLEFSFKPVRFATIDLPAANDKLKPTNVWYMVYSVTNPSNSLEPVEDPSGDYAFGQLDEPRRKFTTEEKARPIRFVPHFLLAAPEFKKTYSDIVIPAAIGPIGQREDAARTFYNSQDISQQEIKPGETVWGIATWVGVDPRVDRFSIFITGLTNAYRWQESPNAYAGSDEPGAGRTLSRKVLKINFWRPGDEYYENEDEIRLGAPGEVDYEWVYR